MIVVNVELWPGGDASRKRLLSRAVIGNDGTGSVGTGNYNVWLGRVGVMELPHRRKPWKQGRVEGFPRARLNSWHLIYRALRACLDKP